MIRTDQPRTASSPWEASSRADAQTRLPQDRHPLFLQVLAADGADVLQRRPIARRCGRARTLRELPAGSERQAAYAWMGRRHEPVAAVGRISTSGSCSQPVNVHGTSSTWFCPRASMGQEAEAEARKRIFENDRMAAETLKIVDRDAVILHGLPAHYGDEIDDALSRRPHRQRNGRDGVHSRARPRSGRRLADAGQRDRTGNRAARNADDADRLNEWPTANPRQRKQMGRGYFGVSFGPFVAEPALEGWLRGFVPSSSSFARHSAAFSA